MKPYTVSLHRRRSNKKYTLKRNWKVVWWSEHDTGAEVRAVRRVYGKRVAANAWRLWWLLYYTPHAIEVELWRGRDRLMRVGAERWRDQRP